MLIVSVLDGGRHLKNVTYSAARSFFAPEDLAF
jgi:hypothetical protein